MNHLPEPFCKYCLGQEQQHSEVVIFKYAISHSGVRKIIHKYTLFYKLLLYQKKTTIPILHVKQQLRNTQRSLKTLILLQLCWLASKLCQITMVIALFSWMREWGKYRPICCIFNADHLYFSISLSTGKNPVTRKEISWSKAYRNWYNTVNTAELFTNNKLSIGYHHLKMYLTLSSRNFLP